MSTVVYALVAACKDRSCAPPPVGTGGSKSSGAGRTGDAVDAVRMSVRHRNDAEAALLQRREGGEVLTQAEDMDLAAVKAVDRYADAYYSEINGALRNGGTHELVPLMDRAFENHSVELTEPIEVHRGIALPQRLGQPFGVGDVVEDKGFMSTTTGDTMASVFMSGRPDSTPTMMRIKVPAGTRVLGGSWYESELILNRGTKVRITSVQGRENKYGRQSLYVEAEVVP